jgi:hypothetical protein
MYGNHTLNLGRVYTKERNKKVSSAVKEWAKTHREHYYRIGVLGALKARSLGLSGKPTTSIKYHTSHNAGTVWV